MIEPRSLGEMIAASRLEAQKTAIVARLASLMPNIKIVAHPGKLDVADVVARAVVAAPGVAVGWTRIRGVRDVAGTFGDEVQWAAYVVTEDRADIATKRSVGRETVAHAIGDFLLEILADPDASSWGLTGVTPAAADPSPEFRPVFTAKSFEQGTAYHAVTWSQTLVDRGTPIFDGDDLDFAPDEGALGGLPPEVRAMLAGADEP